MLPRKAAAFFRVENMAKLLELMQDKQRFSPTDQIIIDYVVKNYQQIPQLTSKQLAQKVYTSSAAIVRFCQRLGLKGYSEFKVRFVAEIMQYGNGKEKKQPITNKDTIRSILDKVTGIELGAVRETRNDMEPADIVRAVYLLEQAEHIDFYAMDNNLYIAELASYAFLHAGKFSTVHPKGNVQYLQAVSSQKDHLAFLISRTGENRRLLEIAQLLKKRKCKLLLITGKKESSLAGLADEVLYAATEKKLNELGSFVFLGAAKYLVDILFSVLLARHYDTSLLRNESYERIFSESN